VLDLAEPNRSGVCLDDGVLAVSEIADLRLEDAELAVLCACHTAANASRFADEAIHPAAAFQLAGFRQVIATSWLVSDDTAADLASRLYRELSRPGRLTADGAPEALHHAVLALRDRNPQAVMTWAAYLHSGPRSPAAGFPQPCDVLFCRESPVRYFLILVGLRCVGGGCGDPGRHARAS